MMNLSYQPSVQLQRRFETFWQMLLMTIMFFNA